MNSTEHILKDQLFEAVRAVLEEQFSQAAQVEALRRKELLRPHEVESLFGISKETLTKMRLHGRGPRYTQFKDGGAVYYEPCDIREYISKYKVRTHEQQ